MVDEEDIIKIGKEIIPNIYDDGAKPAIKEMGNFIARPLKLINFLVKKNDKFKKVDINEFVYNPMNLTLGALDLNNNKITISVSGYYVVMKNHDY